tara:strand:- start:160 stop:402 length:243 start_codon:yes stop_codon:yes gene_type:complete
MAFRLETTIQRWVGNSEEAKPTDAVPVGSTFRETDTGNQYTFDGEKWFTFPPGDAQTPILAAILNEMKALREDINLGFLN